MSFNIIGGTPSGKPLCQTCRFAARINGFAESEQIIICQAVEKGMRVNMHVFSCSLYVERGKLTIYELDNIAWIIEVSKTGTIGFTDPERRRQSGHYGPQIQHGF